MTDTVLPVGFRHLPHNIDAEQALLGSILINNEAYNRVSSILREDHFYEPVHRRLYAWMAAKVDAGQLANHITLKVAFDEDEALRELNGAEYLARLARASELVMNSEDYALVIVDLATKRQIIQLAEAVSNRAYDPSTTETAADQLASLERDLERVKYHSSGDDDIASIDVVAALEMPRPQRQWAVDLWVPKRRLTLMSGDGGTGKSLLAQQLATCTAIGRPWLGLDVMKGKTLLFATEDDSDELTIRHQDICRDLGASADDLDGNLKLVPRVGLENRLIEFEGDVGRMTPTWHALTRSLEQWQPKLLILDNAAQIFAGNENSRPQVTWFCNRLEYLAVRFELTVILLGHTSKSAGSEWSGSTAWNACVRSRMFLNHDPEEDDVRTLTRSKSNYAKKGEGIEVRWDNGVLRTFVGGQSVSMEELGRARQTFKDAIDVLTKRDINVSHLNTSPRNYAPKVIAAHGLAGEHSPKILEKAMMTLIDDGAILTSQPFGKTNHRNTRTGIKRAFAYDP